MRTEVTVIILALCLIGLALLGKYDELQPINQTAEGCAHERC